MKKIPLHSLVIMVGPSGAGKSTIITRKFQPYEVVSSDAIRQELVGDFQRQDVNPQVFREINRRITLKLNLGERVVVDATNLRKEDRMNITNIGLALGVPVFYVVVNRTLEEKIATQGWRSDVPGLVAKHEDVFRRNERDILRGDGVAYVIDTRKEDFEAVMKIPSSNVVGAIKQRGYKGAMAVGDVHGMKESLKSAIDWASARNLFMVFLGDVLDYGPDSLECVTLVHDLVVRGKAIMVIGNHERKIERWFDQVKTGEVRLKLSDGNRATTNLVEALGEVDRRKFECKFRALLNLSRNHWVLLDTLFTHGAAEAAMFDSDAHRLTGKLETLALFGEVDGVNNAKGEGYPNRVYTWVDRIPQGKRVVVGHDIRSTGAPLIANASNGSQAIFLDTGCGKGGHLTTAHLLFKGDSLEVAAFTTH
jgi:protein phosphatase